MEDWGPCSANCGEGIRERRVQCKIFLEFSKTVATLPDRKCPGPKPAETEICFAGLCDGPAETRKRARTESKGKKGGDDDDGDKSEDGVRVPKIPGGKSADEPILWVLFKTAFYRSVHLKSGVS